MNGYSKEMPVASKTKWQILDATTLKFLAVVLMVLDHIHEMFVSMGAPMWLTMAGRLVFPMFLFAASESFYYTHSKKRYLQRLLFASWGMTIFIAGRFAEPRCDFDEQCLQHFLCDGSVYAVLGSVEGGYTAEVTHGNR